VNRIRTHIISGLASHLILTAIAFTVLFGNGAHLHFSAHQLFDHGDFHIVFHSHSSPDEEPGSDSDDKDSHHHSVATIDFNAKISNSIQYVSYGKNYWVTGAFLVDGTHTGFASSEQFSIPPPDTMKTRISSSPFYLRAPPVA
jgi:hypothetical protein